MRIIIHCIPIKRTVFCHLCNLCVFCLILKSWNAIPSVLSFQKKSFYAGFSSIPIFVWFGFLLLFFEGGGEGGDLTFWDVLLFLRMLVKTYMWKDVFSISLPKSNRKIYMQNQGTDECTESAFSKRHNS